MPFRRDPQHQKQKVKPTTQQAYLQDLSDGQPVQKPATTDFPMSMFRHHQICPRELPEDMAQLPTQQRRFDGPKPE